MFCWKDSCTFSTFLYHNTNHFVVDLTDKISQRKTFSRKPQRYSELPGINQISIENLSGVMQTKWDGSQILLGNIRCNAKSSNDAFQKEKEAFNISLVLDFPTVGNILVVSIYTSKYGFRATLAQEGHPDAFLSDRISEANSKQSTGDQELLSSLIALKKRSLYFRGSEPTFRTDN